MLSVNQKMKLKTPLQTNKQKLKQFLFVNFILLIMEVKGTIWYSDIGTGVIYIIYTYIY